VTTFALVHGAFCSAGTWDLLVPELPGGHMPMYSRPAALADALEASLQ